VCILHIKIPNIFQIQRDLILQDSKEVALHLTLSFLSEEVLECVRGKSMLGWRFFFFMHNVVTKFKWEKIIPEEKVLNISFPMPVNGLPILLLPHSTSLE
jgi:hypothetical protein